MEGTVAIIMVFGVPIAGLIVFSPIGKAIAQRIRGPAERPSEEIDELRDTVAQLQAQVSELAERQDFSERVLAKSRDKALGRPE